METCFAAHLGGKAIYFRVLLCGRLSYCSKTTSFWRRLDRWRLIAPYSCHKDQTVTPSFPCNEIRKQSTLTATRKVFEKESSGSFTLHFGLNYEFIYQLNAIEYLLCTFSSTCFGLTRPSSGAMDVKFFYIYSIWCPWCS